MSKVELKPCPVCGGDPEVEVNGCDDLTYHISQAWVECGLCEAQSNAAFNEKYDKKSSEECINKARNEWNNTSIETINK